MGFQFQSVAAVAPLLGSEFGVSIADIGLLIGLYFTPGVALALPGGAIGQKFGDKLTVLGALLLMLAGGLMMAFSTSWSAQIAGRLIAGTGGVLINVQMTKMVADWFAGKEIATAMAMFVNSWPAGVAAALLVLPLIGTGYGVGAVHLGVAAFIACGIVLLATLYQPPANAAADVRDTRASRSQRRHRRDRGGPDLGPVQYRLRDHLQLRADHAGRARLVDRSGGIDHQHRVVDRGGLRSVRRISGRPNRASAIHPGRGQHRVRRPDDRCCRAAAR